MLVQRVKKKVLITKALEALGLDATYNEAKKWVKNNYNADIADPSFYGVRTKMQIAAGVRKPDNKNHAPDSEKMTLIAKAIAALGLDAGYMRTRKWIKSNFDVDVTAGSFYSNRRKLLATKPAEPTNAPVPEVTQEKKAENGNGIIALVKTAKALVEKLGKEEAKNLIDTL